MGVDLSRLPLDPRVGRMIIEARERKMIAVCQKPGVTLEELKAARTAMRQSY